MAGIQQAVEEEVFQDAVAAAAARFGGDIVQSLQAALPGNDGCRLVPRTKTETYEPTEEFFRLHPDDRRRHASYLLDIFAEYVSHNKSQDLVEAELRREAQENSFRPRVMRENMPTSFRQLLNALQYFGYDISSFTHDCDMCPCGFLYR